MTSLLDVPEISENTKEPWDHGVEMLFREARRRERRRRTRRAFSFLAVVAVTVAAMGVGVNSVGSSPTVSPTAPSIATANQSGVLTCSGSSVVRPRRLVVSCADANTLLTSTNWSSWTTARATGTTTFAINLCTPYCAASPISHFPHSSVVLSAPVSSRRGTHFSRLVVRYTQGSATKTFSFSWAGVTR